MKQMARSLAVLRGRWRALGSVAAVVSLICLAPSIGLTQSYPNRPIRLLHGFAAGGAADTMARIVSDGLSKRLGQPVIVEAKPGAGGNLAADAVAKSAPDGYTIGLVTGAHAISGALYKQLAYSPVDSFDMLSTMVYYALVIAVRADHQAKTLADLIAMAKAKPDGLSYGSVGFGSTHQLAGDVPVIVGTTVLLAGQIESGAIRGLAVTSPARTKLLPNVPSAQEAGIKNFDVRTWAGLLVPKGTPPDIVKRLNTEIQSMLADPATKTALETATGGEVRGSTPEEMRALITSETDKWSKVINDAGIPRI